MPQTLASFEKRKVAVQTILRERPDIAWNLIIQLLAWPAPDLFWIAQANLAQNHTR
jgi:hypothetical protein